MRWRYYLLLPLLIVCSWTSSCFGQSSGQQSSVVVGGPSIDWAAPKTGVPKGKVEAFEVNDTQYKIKRKVWVYTPAITANESADRLIVSFDGQDYVKDIPSPTILDNLIAAGKIYPAIQVFVDNSTDRLGDLANHQKFADFVAADLITWIRTNYHVGNDPAKTVLCGYSAGGLGAAYVAFRHPKLFGNVLSQSGAFWRGDEGSSSGFEWLTDQYQRSAKLNIRFYLVVGGAETTANMSGKSMVETNRHLRDVLKAKGNDVAFFEFPSGVHSPDWWTKELPDGLIYLLEKR